jgi:hypothetical protein
MWQGFTGDGPVDAAYKAITSITTPSAKLIRYDIRAVTSGTEALEGRTAGLHLRRLPLNTRFKLQLTALATKDYRSDVATALRSRRSTQQFPLSGIGR